MAWKQITHVVDPATATQDDHEAHYGEEAALNTYLIKSLPLIHSDITDVIRHLSDHHGVSMDVIREVIRDSGTERHMLPERLDELHDRAGQITVDHLHDQKVTDPNIIQIKNRVKEIRDHKLKDHADSIIGL